MKDKPKKEVRLCYNCRKMLRSKKALFCKDCEGKPFAHTSGPIKVSTGGAGITSHNNSEARYIENVERRGNKAVRGGDGIIHEVGK